MLGEDSVLEAGLSYAERMVRTGFFTAEQAAQTCGVVLSRLQERLAMNDSTQAAPLAKPVRSLDSWIPV